MERENLAGDGKGKDAMGGGEEIASIVADVNRWSPNANAERPEPISYRLKQTAH